MLRLNFAPSQFNEENRATGFESRMVDMLLDSCVGKSNSPHEPQWETAREEMVSSLGRQFGQKEKARSAELRKPRKT